MEYKDKKMIYSLQDLLKFNDSPYAVYMENLVKQGKIKESDIVPTEKAIDSEMQKIIKQSGVSFEKFRTQFFITEQKFFAYFLFIHNNGLYKNTLKKLKLEANFTELEKVINNLPDEVFRPYLKQLTDDEPSKKKIKNFKKSLIKLFNDYDIEYIEKRYSQYKDCHDSNDKAMKVTPFSYEIKDPGKDYNASYQLTLDLMEKGVPIIIQGTLKFNQESNNTFIGIADLLVKVPLKKGKSLINGVEKDYIYEVKDIKRSHVAKPKFILQICTYSEMLKDMQGKLPQNGEILLGNYKSIKFKIKDYFAYYTMVKENFTKCINGNLVPIPSIDDHASKKYILKSNEGSLESIPNISYNEITYLKEHNVYNIDALVNCEKCEGLSDANFHRIQTQALLLKNNIDFQLLNQYPNEPYNISNLPIFQENDLFLDIKETDSLDENPFICFYNIMYQKNGEFFTYQLECTRIESEEYMFVKAMMDIGKILNFKKTGKIYCYSDSVPQLMLKTASKYSKFYWFIRKMTEERKMIILKSFLTQNIVLNVKDYTLGNIAKFVNPNLDELQIHDALKLNFESPLLSLIYFPKSPDDKKKIPEYKFKLSEISQQKIKFLYQIYDWLLDVKKQDLASINLENTIRPEELEIDEDSYAAISDPYDDLDKERELKEIDEDSKKIEPEKNKEKIQFSEKEYLKKSPKEKVHILLSQLTSFYAIEDGVQTMDTLDITQANSTDNLKNLRCLNNLKAYKFNEAKRSLFITYKRNPKEETKIKEGDSFKIIGLNIPGKVRQLSKDEITLQINKKYKDLSIYNISIFESNGKLSRPLEKQIREIYNQTDINHETLNIKKSLFDFLMKKRPQFKPGIVFRYGIDLEGNSIDANIIEEGKKFIPELDDSFLVIQGPPGTGKSFTASNIILDLTAKGNKIGISSNSHKAIDGLLLKIRELDKDIPIYKYYSNNQDFNQILHDNNIQDAKRLADDFFTKLDTPYIVGGTVFSITKVEVDYLFIDEAGQVSLANLVIMSQNARNLILIGDQQQLEQPIQAIHSGDSGKSVLEYYLEDTPIVPKDKGFFLNVSYRMCLELCEKVSEYFYDDSLLSIEEVDEGYINPLKLELKKDSIITKDRGIQFISVNHKNNPSHSIEEVIKVVEIVRDLETQDIIVKGKARKITKDDIIIVSPYNMHVSKLRLALPDHNIGSVDLFQGQESAIVIYTLGASDAGSRGIDFLLNKNRTNVALSRGKLLAIIVASEEIINLQVSNIESLKLLNIFTELSKQK